MTRINKIALFLAVAALPGTVLAAPTITFDGEVASQTCSVSINGQQGNVIVMLPTVSVNDFGATPITPGATAGQTSFTVAVSDCAVAGENTNISLKLNGFNIDETSGTLGNRAAEDAATGVSIQLMTDGSGGTPVTLSGVTPIPGLILEQGKTSATHDYGVRYYAMDSDVTAGKVSAVAEYTISYF